MRRLRLVGLSADGRDVVFVDDANAECAAPADDRLRAALRGDRARLGQLEIEMDSVLRPRDIQARVRAGADSPGFIERGVVSVMQHMHTDLGPAELYRLAQAMAQVEPSKVTTCVAVEMCRAVRTPCAPRDRPSVRTGGQASAQAP